MKSKFPLHPNVHLESFESSMLNFGKNVINTPEIKYTISYPLNNPVEVTEKSNNGFSAKMIISSICNNYKRIYKEEEESMLLPAHTKSDILLNRNQTDGKYGIWGHDIGDLFIESIDIDATKTTAETTYLTLFIGS